MRRMQALLVGWWGLALVVPLAAGEATQQAGAAWPRGHYAALVTIAFALLLKTFLEVNDVLGGPQGMQVRAMKIFGWSFNDNIEIGKISLSFYMNYFVVALLLLVAAFVLVRRLERSWIGLNFDALRLDETAASCFGLNIVRWKITAFLLGNFLIGIAGALFGMVGGFVAPSAG